jgi:hypothetical protein
LACNFFGRVYATKGCFGILKRWSIEKSIGGYFFIKHVVTGLYLEAVPNHIYARKFKNIDRQKWRMNGRFIIHKLTGMALDSNLRGSVYLHQFNAGIWQQWLFIG